MAITCSAVVPDYEANFYFNKTAQDGNFEGLWIRLWKEQE
jgi:hypothetical protein